MKNRYLIAAGLLAAALSLCSARAARAQAGAASAGPSSKDASDAGDFYSCPMHPEVRAKKKGRCPVCGMDLRLTHAAPKPSGEAAKPGLTEAGPVNMHSVAGPTSVDAAGGADAHGLAASYGSSKMPIPDVELLDQDGRRVRFYSDLVKGRVVAIQFIFTTCTTICPPLGATFARVQKELGERAGRDVRLISISVDPATDTPERLKAWAAKFHAADGWTLVTGPKQRVDELLRALGAATASPADHSPTVLIGNEAAGQWTRTYGLARPGVLVKLIGEALGGRLDSSADSAAEGATRQ